MKRHLLKDAKVGDILECIEDHGNFDRTGDIVKLVGFFAGGIWVEKDGYEHLTSVTHFKKVE